MKFFIKHHSWILGILALLISIVVPIYTIPYQHKLDERLVLFEHGLEQGKETKTYYFANTLGQTQYKGLDDTTCWVRSLSSTRSDAYRCMTQSYIMDPCFVDPFDYEVVVCPENPYGKNKYFKANITDEAREETIQEAKNEDPIENYPWYIKLFDGRECNFITGATTVMADRRMDYGCSGEGNETDNFLLLPIQKEDKLLKIGCMNKGQIEDCEIKEAWY